MVTVEQKERLIKAKVAVALHHEFGRTPSKQEIEYVYHLARVLRKSVLGTHFLSVKQKQQGQLALF
jgi:hypothetical protein